MMELKFHPYKTTSPLTVANAVMLNKYPPGDCHEGGGHATGRQFTVWRLLQSSERGT